MGFRFFFPPMLMFSKYHLAENDYIRDSLINSKTILPQSITYRNIVTGLMYSKNIWSSKDYSNHRFSLLTGDVGSWSVVGGAHIQAFTLFMVLELS